MSAIESALAHLVEDIAAVERVESVGGGCISAASRVDIRLHGGARATLFVKSNDASFRDNFEAELDGLKRLARVGSIRVPEPLKVAVVDQQSWLVSEWIRPGSQVTGYFERFGRDLAALHRSSLGSRIGLDRDNYLGASLQINAPMSDWAPFVAEHRIGDQLKRAVDGRLADGALQRDGERIIRSMDHLLEGRDRETSLLHGDLWSGNYLCDEAGKPVVIDPAVYYGCREAEFGMLRLFGSCPESFYASYLESFPLSAGWQRRVNVYVLYHLLNHLNLFGRGYLDSCRSKTAEILSSD